MPMRPTDRLIHPSRGNPDQAIAWARQAGARRLDQVEAFIREVYRLCDLVGLDAAILVAHSAVETGDPVRGGGWRSPAWSERLNPSGLGITDGGDLGYRFASGVDAARAHVVHHYLYAKGLVPPDSPLEPYVTLDPRYNAVPAAWRGAVRTIADLTGKWWTKSAGHVAVAERGNHLFPNLPDQQKETTLMPTRPYVLVVAGHRSYGDAGNPEEKRLTPALADAYERALEAAGYQVTHLQREWDKDADPDDTVGGLDTVGRKAAEWMAATPGPLVMLDCHYEGYPPSARGVFAIVPDKRHLGTAIAAPQPANDNWESNSLDVALARAISREISRETGLPLRTAGVREPGVMSETQTGVAYQYNARLAMFAYTAPHRDRAVRLVVEHGNLSNAEDRQSILRNDFTERCARAVVRAVNEVYGQQQAAPAPKKVVAPAYPPGMDQGIAAWRFGRIERGGKVYQFNPKGPISRAWLKYGARYGYTPIVDVWRFDDGREYVAFGSFTLWRPNATEEFAPIESGEAGP